MNLVLIEALVFGLKRLAEAAEERGAVLHLLTRDKSAYYSELARISGKNLRVTEMDTFNLAAILAYCRGLEHFGGIINLTDTWAKIADEAAAALGCPRQNPEALALCRDKFRLREHLAAKGLTKGRAYVFSAAEFSAGEAERRGGALQYPLIVKDPAGTGSKNVWFADSPRRFAAACAQARAAGLSRLLAETYFKGALFSAETLSRNGQTRCLALSSRVLSDMPHFMEKAFSLPISAENAELRGAPAWAARALEAVGYTDGFAHTEFIVTAGGFEVVEVNPRLGGAQIGEALCRALGCNIYRAFIETALGEEPELMRSSLAPRAFIGQVMVYAPRKGRFKAIDARHINAEKTSLSLCAAPGRRINSLSDQSACVAIVSCAGTTSELALLFAFAEANKLTVQMEEGDA